MTIILWLKSNNFMIKSNYFMINEFSNKVMPIVNVSSLLHVIFGNVYGTILSQYKVMILFFNSTIIWICFIQDVFAQYELVETYLVSAVDKDIAFCFLLCQATKLFPRWKQFPEVFFLSSTLSAHSAFENQLW